MFDMFVKESRGKWATGIFSCKVAYEITLRSILGCLWVNKKIYIAESGWQHRVRLGTAIPDVPQESLRYLKLVGLDAHGCPCAVWWQPLFLVIQSCVTGLDLNHLKVAAIGSLPRASNMNQLHRNSALSWRYCFTVSKLSAPPRQTVAPFGQNLASPK